MKGNVSIFWIEIVVIILLFSIIGLGIKYLVDDARDWKDLAESYEIKGQMILDEKLLCEEKLLMCEKGGQHECISMQYKK